MPKYGTDYKTMSIVCSPEEHKVFKMKSAEYGVTLTEVCRLALNDDATWKRAAKAKQAERKAAKAEKKWNSTDQ